MFIHQFMRFAVLTTAILLGTGCASTPKINVIEPGQELAIHAYPDADELEVLSGNDAIGKGAVAGAGAGLATGVVAGLTCGPWAPVCVPLGGLSMAVVGGAGGAVVGAATSLNSEDKAAILEQLNRYLETEDANVAFRRQLGDRLDTNWTIVKDGDNVVRISLTKIAVRGELGGNISLDMRADVITEACLSCEKPRRVEAVFVHSSNKIPAETWIANEYDFVKSEVYLAYSGMTAQIDAALSPR